MEKKYAGIEKKFIGFTLVFLLLSVIKEGVDSLLKFNTYIIPIFFIISVILFTHFKKN